MKNIGLAIFVILLLVGCENNKSSKSSLNDAQISQNDIEYFQNLVGDTVLFTVCLLYTSPSPRDRTRSRMPSSA